MLRLRCPHKGCSIEVADDKVGEWIRCPQCDQLLIADPQHKEAAGLPIQPATPTVTLAPKRGSAAASPLENRLYAGMPPLAMMLGVRTGRGGNWKDDGAVRAQMTDADWKALAAFEKVLHATTSLTMALIHGSAATLITLLLWWAAAITSGDHAAFVSRHFGGWLVTVVILAHGFALMFVGRRRLDRLKLGVLVELVTWTALGVALVFVVLAARNGLALWDTPSNQAPFTLALLAIPFQLFAAFGAGMASLGVQRAQKCVSPPEILQPLAEALTFLNSVRD